VGCFFVANIWFFYAGQAGIYVRKKLSVILITSIFGVNKTARPMYKITFKNSAQKELEALPKQAIKKIVVAIDGLAEDPRPAGVKKLKNSKEDLYRIRAGDYRVLYSITDVIRIVTIIRIGHRREIYRFD
jgi:mRNA interferase RelE/StbE